MNRKISEQPMAVRFDHLLGVISGQRFLEMRGLNNDLPFTSASSRLLKRWRWSVYAGSW